MRRWLALVFGFFRRHLPSAAEESCLPLFPVPLPDVEATASRRAASQLRRERRRERYDAVHRLHQAKGSIREIATM